VPNLFVPPPQVQICCWVVGCQLAGVGFGGPQPTIVFNRTDEPKAGKLRLHIDVNATDREQDDELERVARGRRPPSRYRADRRRVMACAR
jgi:hypothetical protein